MLVALGACGGCEEESTEDDSPRGSVANAPGANPDEARPTTPDGYEIILGPRDQERRRQAEAEQRERENANLVRTPTVPDPANGEFDMEEAVVGLGTDGVLVAEISTTLGTIFCDLFPQHAPRTVANFIGLANGRRPWWDPRRGEWRTNEPYYDSTIFHRVIPEYLIQGGDVLQDGSGTPGYTIPDEPHPEMTHDRAGLLCMASTDVNENGAQFFITDGPAPDLAGDSRYSIFGRCKNLDIIERIARVPQDETSRPRTPVVLERVRVRRVPGGSANAVRSPPQLPEGVTPEEFFRHASPGPGQLWPNRPGSEGSGMGEDPLDPRTFRPPGGDRVRVEE